MKISLIMAAARDGLIGQEGKLPWHLPSDLKRFRAITWGKPILMGRRTFESLGRPLPGRRNIVLSHQPSYHPVGAEVVASLTDGLELAAQTIVKDDSELEVMVIGGAQVFADATPLADRAYLTLVEGTFQGDVYFPIETFANPEWQLVAEVACPADDKNPHPVRYLDYHRKRER